MLGNALRRDQFDEDDHHSGEPSWVAEFFARPEALRTAEESNLRIEQLIERKMGSTSTP